MANANTTEIGFEKEIWKAADVLRGNLDASEYKSVILGLIFLKYLSDRFSDRYQELLDEGEGFEEEKDEYTAEGIFYIPESARWDVIAKAAHTPEIGTVIDDAMRSIEAENLQLKDVLPKNFSRPELDKRRLGDVVDLFTNVKMQDSAESKDLLGRTYEYCLAKFAENEGKKAGEFYTPSCVVRTLVEVLQPYNGRVYDPCCGSGGMFVQSAKFVENHGGNLSGISVFGQDSNPTTRKLAQMNLAIRGIDADLGQYSADTFFEDLHPQLKADFILANPPFNIKNWGADKLQDDPRWKYGLPPAGNANYAWIQHMLWHLAPKGRIGLVLANGSLSSQSGGEGAIRKNIVDDDLVECIVALPTQLFYTAPIPVSLWFLAKDKKQKGKTLFIDARKMGTMVSRKLRELSDEDIRKIADTYNAFVGDSLEDEPGFCAVVTTEDIAAQDYILTPGRYVGLPKQEDDGVPFEDRMCALTSELAELFETSHKLEDKIQMNLATLGILQTERKKCMITKAVTLGEVCSKIGSGATPKGGKEAYKNEGIALIRSQNVLDYSFSHTGIAYIDEVQAAKLENVAVEPGDVLLNITGDSVARVCMVDDAVLPARVNQHVAIVRTDNNLLDGRFLLYYLQWQKRALLQLASFGGTRNALTKAILTALKLEIPDMKTQHQIAGVLGALDDKIETNERIIENLKKQAQIEYARRLSEFSTGATIRLKDIAFVDSTVFDPKKELEQTIEHYSIPAFDAGGFPVFESSTCIKSNKYLVDENCVLVSKLNPGTKRIWIPYGLTQKAVCSTEFVVLREHNETELVYLYAVVNEPAFSNYISERATGTTGSRQRVSPSSILEYEFPAMSSEGSNFFVVFARPVLDLARTLAVENNQLRRLRDLLLPRLMSGEIDVSGVVLDDPTDIASEISSGGELRCPPPL